MNSLIKIMLCNLLLITQSFSQITISGNVTDVSTKHGIEGSTVNISNLKRVTYTDVSGNFRFENVPKGIYIFEISNIGFKSLSRKIIIENSTDSLSFALNESPTELNEVVITGVTRLTEISKSPIIIKALDSRKLSQSASTNLIDGLKNIPGISQITSGAAISKPIIRGLGYNRVISLVEGIKQEGQQWGDEHGIEIDEYAVERIEIIKGPGSLLYGSDGIAGVINFIGTKTPPEGEIISKISTNYQTNNHLWANSISNTGNKNNVQWLARFTQKVASNFTNKTDGKVLNSAFKEVDGNAFIGFNKKWGYSHFNFASYNNKLALPEGTRDFDGKFTFEGINSKNEIEEFTASNDQLNSNKIGIPNQNINHLRLSNSNYIQLKKGSLNSELGFQNNKRKEFGNVYEPNLPEAYFLLNTFNYNLRYNFEAKNNWETTLGTSGMLQRNANKGEEYIIPDYNLNDIGGFVFSQKTIKNKLTLAGGIRLDNRWIKANKLILSEIDENGNTKSYTKFNGFKKQFASISGSIGASLKMTESSNFKLNISRGFRAPNIAELGSNGQHEGTFRYEIGNENLKPEYSHQIDFGYFLNADHITFEFTPFINNISNFIFIEKQSNQVQLVDNESDTFRFVQGNAQLFGGEIYFDLHPHPLDWLHIENSFSFVNAVQKNQPDSLKYLPFVPSPKFRLELKAEKKSWNKTLTNTYLKFAYDYYFEQNNYLRAFNTETYSPKYSLLSMGMGAILKNNKNKEFLNIIFSAENLANSIYQNHLNRLKYGPVNPLTGQIGIFNMGINFSFKTTISI